MTFATWADCPAVVRDFSRCDDPPYGGRGGHGGGDHEIGDYWDADSGCFYHHDHNSDHHGRRFEENCSCCPCCCFVYLEGERWTARMRVTTPSGCERPRHHQNEHSPEVDEKRPEGTPRCPSGHGDCGDSHSACCHCSSHSDSSQYEYRWKHRHHHSGVVCRGVHVEPRPGRYSVGCSVAEYSCGHHVADCPPDRPHPHFGSPIQHLRAPGPVASSLCDPYLRQEQYYPDPHFPHHWRHYRFAIQALQRPHHRSDGCWAHGTTRGMRPVRRGIQTRTHTSTVGRPMVEEKGL